MVDHVKILLLNMPVGAVAGVSGMSWRVDESFMPVAVPGSMKAFRDGLFYGAESAAEKVGRVDALFPFTQTPELGFALKAFDPRVSRPPSTSSGYSTVFDFYRNLSPGGLEVVKPLASSPDSNSVFAPPDAMGRGFLDILSALSVVAMSTPELVMRFSSMLLAYAVQLENLRLKSVGRASV